MSENRHITKPVIIFDFVYEVRTAPKSTDYELTRDHPEIEGTILGDSTVLYPSLDNVVKILKKELITGHKLKKFKLDKSSFSFLSNETFTYKRFDFRELIITVGKEPKELIDGIQEYVIKRAMKYED